MRSWLKNNIVKLVGVIISILFMIGSYTLLNMLYGFYFITVAHRSAGMIFISFFFLFIAAPMFFLVAFTPIKVGFLCYFITIFYVFYEWYSDHPLRVILMAICTTIGYLSIFLLRKRLKV
jgi:hypothetical protein